MLALTSLALKGIAADSTNRATCIEDHLPPRAAGMPRSSIGDRLDGKPKERVEQEGIRAGMPVPNETSN
jgi:hypothetical protein